MTTEKDPLISIIGDKNRVAILRLCALNPEHLYSEREFAKALKTTVTVVRSVLKRLEGDGIVAKRKLTKKEQKEKETKETVGHLLNKRYKHIEFLRDLVDSSLPSEKDVLMGKIARVPGVKVVLSTNVFKEKDGQGVDILIASSEPNSLLIEQLIREAEQIIGREILCSTMSANDLAFRIQTSDRFIMDILESAPTVYLDRLGLLGEQSSV